MTAVFADTAAAQAAAVAMESIGFTQDSIVVVTGDQLLRNELAVREQRDLADRLLAWFPSDEAMIVERYIELAKQGHAVVAVYVPQSEPERRDRAADTLQRNGGSYMYYYGERTVMDL